MTDARSTDGSKRVSSANQPMSASVPAQRVAGPQPVAAPATPPPGASATFSPDTALEMRQAGLRGRSSTSVGRLAAVVTDHEAEVQAAVDRIHRARAAVERAARTRLAERASGGPSPTSSTSGRPPGRPTMWRLRSQPAHGPGRRDRIRPSTASCSPARRVRSRRAVPAEGPQLQVATGPRRPSAATPARAERDPSAGSPRRANGADGTGAAAAHAWPASAATQREAPERPARGASAHQAAQRPARRRPRPRRRARAAAAAASAAATVTRATGRPPASPGPRAGDATRRRGARSIDTWPGRA